MGFFDDLLKNTGGLPDGFRQDVEATAATLEVVVGMSKTDLDRLAQETYEKLPELRAERAAQLREQARHERDKAEKAKLTADADKLEKSAAKLAAPDASEAYKRRAALVELSVRLNARLRQVQHNAPSIDPERLAKFNKALTAVADSLPPEIGVKAKREEMARMAFVAELRSAGGNVDLAVDNFYKGAFEDKERGHHGSVGLDAADFHDAGRVEDYVTRKIETETEQERAALASQNNLLQNLPKIAAEHLSPKEYAAYRIMIDNDHLIDWKIEKDGKIRFMPKTLDASDPENTVGKIVQRELDYQNIRGANMLIESTVEKLNGLVRDRGAQDTELSDKGRERMQKTTKEVVADPAAKARAPKGKGVGIE
ncbi:hypothetical protein [Acidithiobacillus caldus]|uniref:hypothetical protein n=1 Tax=Acidithiobacillus caldus TaxID=33059 RepID=UPI0007D8EC4F|nr:hypothetical protein [Acidithiobacillus caldus]QER43211.1 hypothetical protein F0726_00119 [Acidithiobacillus caldus]